MRNETGIKWDEADSTGKGGKTTTDNNCRRLLHDQSVRKIITD